MSKEKQMLIFECVFYKKKENLKDEYKLQGTQPKSWPGRDRE